MRTTSLTCFPVPIGVAIILAIASPVSAGPGASPSPGPVAQPDAAPRLIVSVGGAKMDPVHGDDYPEGPVVLGAVGFAVTPRLGLEAEVTRRAYGQSTSTDNVILPYSGLTGVPGRADRQVYGRETSDWTLGLNVIGRTPPHLVTVFAGAGAMLHREHLRNYRSVTNCTPPAGPAGPQPAACMEFDDRSVTSDVGLQGLAGADVRIARRWQAFGAVRYEMRADLGMGSFGFMGGVRVGIR